MSKPKRRPPFFLRKLFVVTVLILLVAAGVGAWFALDFVRRYEQKAAEFDLSKLDAVESASVIYDRYGQVFGKIFIQNREQVTLDQISPYLVDAVVADEINQPVFASYASRPDIRAHLLEVLGFADAGKGISHHSLDQLKNP